MKGVPSRTQRKRAGYSMVELLLVMLLLCIFALTVATLIQSGAQAYHTINGNMGSEAGARIALSYINVRIRQNDAAGALSIAKAMGGDALVFAETYDGADYYTWIYYSDGALMEAPLLNKDEAPDISKSELIANIDGFDIAFDETTCLLSYGVYYTRDTQAGQVRMRMNGSSLLKAGVVSDWR